MLLCRSWVECDWKPCKVHWEINEIISHPITHLRISFIYLNCGCPLLRESVWKPNNFLSLVAWKATVYWWHIPPYIVTTTHLRIRWFTCNEERLTLLKFNSGRIIELYNSISWSFGVSGHFELLLQMKRKTELWWFYLVDWGSYIRIEHVVYGWAGIHLVHMSIDLAVN